MKKYRMLVVIVLILLCLSGCGRNSEGDIEKQQIALIESYLQNLKSGNVDEAVKNVKFTDGEIKAGMPAVFCDAMEGYDYKEYTINGFEKLNDFVYLTDAVVNTNFDSENKSDYIDVEFNPFVIFYEDKYWIAFVKEQVPPDLYKDLGELPDNYEDNLEYILIEEDDIILK